MDTISALTAFAVAYAIIIALAALEIRAYDREDKS